MKINDLDLKNWKNLDINVNSLWIIDKRDNSGVHSASYHGNFVPQIPNQLLRRFTKQGDFILDPFLGSGTTLIESQRLNRNGIGIELQAEVAKNSKQLIKQEENAKVISDVYIGDSSNFSYEKLLDKYNIKNVQFILYHPPYWDIIKFSNNEKDLSNTKSLNEFLSKLEKVIVDSTKILEKGRYCAIVIGDMYKDSQVIPLGFYCMQLFLKNKLKLKAILIKNFNETKGKQNQQALWRYRALANNLYLFKHEYIFIFRK